MRFSLSKKAIFALGIILLPIFIAFIVGYRNNRERIKEHIIDDLTLVSEVFEGQVFQFLEMTKRRAQDFSTDSFIRSSLAGGAKPSPALSVYLKQYKLPLYSQISSVHVISTDGRVIASTDEHDSGSDVSASEFFVNARRAIPVTETLHGPNGEHGIAVSVPVIKDERLIGFLSTFTRLHELDKVLSGEFNKELGALTWEKGRKLSFEAYLTNRDKVLITSSKFFRNALIRRPVDTEPVRACIDESREMTGFYKDYRGIEVIGSSMCLPSLKWTLLVEVDAEEALSSVRKMRNDAIVTIILVAFLAALLFYFFQKKIVLQLRRISDAAKAVSEGNYNVTLPQESHDEIGALSETFSLMASGIKTRDFAIRESEEKYRTLIDNIPDVTWRASVDGSIVFISQNVQDMLGYGEDAFISDPALLFNSAHADDIDGFRLAMQRLFSEEKRMDFEFRAKRKDKREVWLSARATTTYLKDGVRYADGVLSDITKRKSAEYALRESELRLNEAQHLAHIGSWDWDILEGSLYWSDEIYDIFGMRKNEFKASYEIFIECVHPDDRVMVHEAVSATLNGIKPYSLDHRIMLPDGQIRSVHEQGDVQFTKDGRPCRMVGTVQDVTEAKQKDLELRKLSAAIEYSVNIVFITDVKGTIEYVNPTFVQVTGYSSEEAVGQTPRILASGEIPNESYEALWSTITSGKTWRSTIKNRTKTGGYYWCNSVISPIKDPTGRITNFLAVQEDITEKMVSEERAAYLTRYDALTGLINRTCFMKMLDEWITTASAMKQTGALLLIDVDQFKFINESYGHATGDEFLRRMATLLVSEVSLAYPKDKSDNQPFIAHLSGDEFAIFIPSVVEQEAITLAERLRAAIEAFRFAEHLSIFTASVGVVLYPGHGLSTIELFTRVDAAMYRAKELGRNRVHLYKAEDRDLEKLHSRLSWREKISKALSEDRFEPWFQPILDLNTGSVHHYEVLARMRDEDDKVILPGAFIDIAERFGLIGEIDRAITEKAIRFQAKTMREGKKLTFGMNLSGKNLGDESLLEFLEKKIAEAGADPSALLFEITETAAIGDLGRARKFIKALKALGCSFALDDFGVGFTSFSYLKEMNVDYIKIDGSFIKKLLESADDQVFVRTMSDMARGLGIKSIAEFVEIPETLRVLKMFGVDYAQGYLIGKPHPDIGDNMDSVGMSWMS